MACRCSGGKIGLSLSLLLIFSITSNGDDGCSFDVDGNKYDLSSIKGQTFTASSSQTKTRIFPFTVCQNQTEVCNDIFRDEKRLGAVYQEEQSTDATACWFVLAKWGGQEVRSLDSSAHTDASGKPTGYTAGVTFYFNNGDACDEGIRQVTLNIACSSKSEKSYAIHKQGEPCNTYITFPHPSGCPAGALSNGTIFLIILICSIIVYMAGLFIYRGVKTSSWNPLTVDNCVHREFWSKIPFYFITGVKLSYYFCLTHACSKCPCKKENGNPDDLMDGEKL